MRSAEEYRDEARWMVVREEDTAASMLREAAEMKEVLDNILRAVDSKELLTGPVERARAILGGKHE